LVFLGGADQWRKVMKKIIFALVAAGLSLPTAALAQEPDGIPGRFETRGECQSAVKKAFRDERMDEEPGPKRGQPDAPRFKCVEDPDGGFNAVEE
jgi:hypothetical protein